MDVLENLLLLGQMLYFSKARVFWFSSHDECNSPLQNHFPCRCQVKIFAGRAIVFPFSWIVFHFARVQEVKLPGQESRRRAPDGRGKFPLVLQEWLIDRKPQALRGGLVFSARLAPACPFQFPVPESDMLCGLFCALSIITALSGAGIVITALLRELGVVVVVLEVGRAAEDCPEPHIDQGSVGGQIYGHAGAGQRTPLSTIDCCDGC